MSNVDQIRDKFLRPIKSDIDLVVNAGLKKLGDNEELRERIRFVNLNGLNLCTIGLVLSIIFCLTGLYYISIVSLVTSFLFVFASVGFNSVGFFNASRISAVLIGAVYVTVAAFYFGPKLSPQTLLLTGAIFPFTSFSTREWKYIVFSLMIPVVCYCVLVFYDFNLGPRIPLHAHSSELLFSATFMLLPYIIICSTAYMALSQREVALKQASKAQAEMIQTAKLASVGVLSAGIAHEINNHLNYTNGAMSALSKVIDSIVPDYAKRDAKELMDLARKGMDSTLDIVKSLKGHTGFKHEQLKSHSLASILSSSITLLTGRLQDVKIDIDVPPELKVFANETSLGQVLLNLISNAVDAVSAETGGSISVVAAKTRVLDRGGWVEILISDNGIGIPENLQVKVFDPFFTTKDVGSGSGLGLYVVKTELRRGHGKITLLKSSPKGTTFQILVPETSDSFLNSPFI